MLNFNNQHELHRNLSIHELKWILKEIRCTQTSYLKKVGMGGETFRKYINEDTKELPLFMVDAILYFCGDIERFKHLRAKYEAQTSV